MSPEGIVEARVRVEEQPHYLEMDNLIRMDLRWYERRRRIINLAPEDIAHLNQKTMGKLSKEPIVYIEMDERVKTILEALFQGGSLWA